MEINKIVTEEILKWSVTDLIGKTFNIDGATYTLIDAEPDADINGMYKVLKDNNAIYTGEIDVD